MTLKKHQLTATAGHPRYKSWYLSLILLVVHGCMAWLFPVALQAAAQEFSELHRVQWNGAFPS